MKNLKSVILVLWAIVLLMFALSACGSSAQNMPQRETGNVLQEAMSAEGFVDAIDDIVSNVIADMEIGPLIRHWKLADVIDAGRTREDIEAELASGTLHFTFMPFGVVAILDSTQYTGEIIPMFSWETENGRLSITSDSGATMVYEYNISGSTLTLYTENNVILIFGAVD